MHRYWGFVDFNFAPAVVVHGDVVLYVWRRRTGGVAEPVISDGLVWPTDQHAVIFVMFLADMWCVSQVARVCLHTNFVSTSAPLLYAAEELDTLDPVETPGSMPSSLEIICADLPLAPAPAVLAGNTGAVAGTSAAGVDVAATRSSPAMGSRNSVAFSRKSNSVTTPRGTHVHGLDVMPPSRARRCVKRV